MACAPGRKRRRSGKLGRETCLTEEEEDAALRGNPNKRQKSDQALAKALGKKNILRPKMPKEWLSNPRTWLSDLDIDAAMKQYADEFPSFQYLGTMPVDFAEKTKRGACVKVCSKAPFRDVVLGKKLGATIINLDVHTGKGTHWVALALDCRGATPRLMFYDSTGTKPPARWMKKTSPYALILAAFKKRETRRKVAAGAVYNKAKHQRRNTECGVFAMMFVDAMIFNRTFESHCAKAIDDEDAFRKREAFFCKSCWNDILGR